MPRYRVTSPVPIEKLVEDEILVEREMIQQRFQVGGERVVVIAGRGLARPAEPSRS